MTGVFFGLAFLAAPGLLGWDMDAVSKEEIQNQKSKSMLLLKRLALLFI